MRLLLLGNVFKLNLAAHHKLGALREAWSASGRWCRRLQERTQTACSGAPACPQSSLWLRGVHITYTQLHSDSKHNGARVSADATA